METVVILLAGLVIGAVAGYLAGRNGRQSLVTRAEVLRTQLDEQEKRHSEAMAALQEKFDETLQKVTAQMKFSIQRLIGRRLLDIL